MGRQTGHHSRTLAALRPFTPWRKHIGKVVHTFIARDARTVTAAPGWSEVIAGWQEAFPLVTESVPDPPSARRRA